jgi:hypothetical protein
MQNSHWSEINSLAFFKVISSCCLHNMIFPGLEVEKKYGLPVHFLAGEINFSLPFLFIELQNDDVLHKSYCKNQCLHDWHFYYF